MANLILNKIAQVNAAVAAEVRAEFGRQRDKTITELSRISKIRRPTLSQKINGHSALSPGELHAISAYLGVSVQELFQRAENAINAKSTRGAA